ncbi:MAG: type II toxin-antitoxin system RelB/DinJ family antitoxin [Coriobacteriales bacterium]
MTARVESETKAAAARALEQMGVTASFAIQALWEYLERNEGRPAQLHRAMSLLRGEEPGAAAGERIAALQQAQLSAARLGALYGIEDPVPCPHDDEALARAKEEDCAARFLEGRS